MRNAPYRRSSIGIRERHNERRNLSYANSDIVPEMSSRNVSFHKCDTTYEQALDKMLGIGMVSSRGLKQDAKVFAEMVFDVNTAYFEQHGGYEYAKQFYEEVYRFAQNEVGGDYILSAVMHADEKNKSLSEQLGYDVFHYHLHVVYIPVVKKEIKWSKRCKDKSLIGRTKEVINQISHSKKWAFVETVDKQGNKQRIPSYSLLQDRYFNHMEKAGYEDFERGVRGSNAEHLSVVEFKVQQDTQKLNELDKRIKARQNDLTAIESELTSAQDIRAMVQEVEKTGKQKMFGKVELTRDEYIDLTTLAKEGIVSRAKILDLQQSLSQVTDSMWRDQKSLQAVQEQAELYFKAIERAPELVQDCFEKIFEHETEVVERTDRPQRQRTRQVDLERGL